MTKLVRVARREFLYNLRRRAFLLLTIGLPLIILAGQIFLVRVVASREEGEGDRPNIGYIDEWGLVAPDEAPWGLVAYPDETAARADLLEKRLAAYFLIPADYLETGKVIGYAEGDISEWMEEEVRTLLIASLLTGQPGDVLARVDEPMDLTFSTLDGSRTFSRSSSLGFLFPLFFTILFMVSIFVSSGYLLQGLGEEKENRVMEILVSSVSSLQLMAGKIIGLGALGLFQLLVWFAFAAAIIQLGAGYELFRGVNLPLPFVAAAVVYFLLGYLIYAAVMAGVGAVTTTLREGQQLSSLFSLAAALPFLVVHLFLSDANGSVPVILSLFPFSAPIAMMLRLAFAQVPAWHIGLSLLILAATLSAAIWAAARIFRMGLLFRGKRPSLAQIARTLRTA